MTESNLITHINSRDNAFVKNLRRLSHDSTAYRKQRQVWLEGDHLCRAALARHLQPTIAIFSESFWPLAQAEWARSALKITVLSDGTPWRPLIDVEDMARAMVWAVGRSTHDGGQFLAVRQAQFWPVD